MLTIIFKCWSYNKNIIISTYTDSFYIAYLYIYINDSTNVDYFILILII